MARNHKSIIYSGVILTISFSAALLSSCSEESLDSVSKESRLIRFDVTEASDASSDDFITRAGLSSPLDILQLQGNDKPLYLVPVVEECSPISDTTPSTRSQLTDATNMVSFGVYAGYASEAGTTAYNPNYMSNIEISRDNDWMPHAEYLWPGDGALHFNAYSPYFSNETDNGINSISVINGIPQLDYTVPEEVADQTDLLYASPIDASSSPCNLTFNHALTAIRFVTGAEMAPCTIKSITISGSKKSGSLNLETGEWSNLSEEASFTVAPMVTLSAEENSQYVAPGTEITSIEQTFILIPQELGESSTLSIVVEADGSETTLTTSLSSQVFPEGKTITYRISANPKADSLILNVTGDFKTEYTGSTISFNVKSSLNDNGVKSPVSWIAEYVDDNGNVIPQPDWISEFTLNGDGDTEGTISTVMQDLVFENMSDGTKVLQDAADINTSSGNSPYNLASQNGGVAIENTANTYIINAPGKYSLPLVYGNAIKNGADNKQSYVPGTHNSRALKNFTNHLNNAITSPYIYENSGCIPSDAILIWEDELNLVRNVTLSSDGKSLLFDVPQNTIRQGNALLAVRDADKNVMWSWQIWVTDYDSSNGAQSITTSGKTYGLASANLGYVAGGDKFSFPECSVKVRFTQTGLPEGIEPLTKTVTLTQSGVELETPDYNTYYQWGRKDPMMPDNKAIYDAVHKEITTHPVASATDLANIKTLMELFIQHPDTFYRGSHDSDETSANYTTYPYNNFWNGAYNTSNIKTIYDPNPVGFVVPYTDPLLDFTPESKTDPKARYEFRYSSTSSASEKQGFYVTVKASGEIIYFPDFGYISGATGLTNNSGEFANYWLSHAIQTLKTGGIVQFYTAASEAVAQQTTDPLFHGMSIRGIRE